MQIQSSQDPKPKVSSANMRRKQRLNTIQIGTENEKAQRNGMRVRWRGKEKGALVDQLHDTQENPAIVMARDTGSLLTVASTCSVFVFIPCRRFIRKNPTSDSIRPTPYTRKQLA